MEGLCLAVAVRLLLLAWYLVLYLTYRESLAGISEPQVTPFE